MTIARLSLLALLGVSMTTLAACGSSAEEPAVATISPPTSSAAYSGLSDEQANAVLFFDDRDLTTKSGSPTAQNEQAVFFSGSGFAEDGIADTATRGFRTGADLTLADAQNPNVQGISTATLYSGSPKFGEGANALTPFHLSWEGSDNTGGPNTNTDGSTDAPPLFIAPGIVGLADADVGVIRPEHTAPGFNPGTQGQYLLDGTHQTVDYSKDPRTDVGAFGPSVKNFAKPSSVGFGSGAPGGLAVYNLEARTIDGTSTYGWQGVPTGSTITSIENNFRNFDVDLIYPSVKDGAWKLQYSTFVLVRASLKGDADRDLATGIGTSTTDAPNRFLNVFTFVRNRDFADTDAESGDWKTTRGELGNIYASAGTSEVKLQYEARLAAWGVVAKGGAEEVWLLFGKNLANDPFTVTFGEESKHNVLGEIVAYSQQVGSKAGVIPPSGSTSTASFAGIIEFDVDFRTRGLNKLETDYTDDDNPDRVPFDVGLIGYEAGGKLQIRKGTFAGPVANEFVLEILITPPDAADGDDPLPTYLGAVIGQRNGVPAIPVTTP